MLAEDFSSGRLAENRSCRHLSLSFPQKTASAALICVIPLKMIW